MKEIDKTKQNLRINEIDEFERKHLFNKFVDSGGKVLSEKETKRSLIIDRGKQKQHQQKIDTHFSNKRIPKYDKNGLNAKASINKDQHNQYIYKSRPFEKLRIRLKLWIYGITGFSPFFFKKTFFKKFANQYKPSLIEIQLIYFALFKKEPATGNRIINSLDRISPLYYEVIEKAGEIYVPYLIDQILEGYMNFPDVPQALSELKESLTELYRVIYILKPYENTIYNSFEKSIDISQSYSEGKKDKNISKRDLKNSQFIIFNKLYPRLHIIFCHYHAKLFTETDARIDDLLSIIQSEKPGNRVRKSDITITQAEIPEEKKKPDSEQISEHADVSEPVREGLKYMYKFDNKTLRNFFDKKNKFEYLNDSDKVLLAYMLFLEFEKEYSFILTTNQIKYNVDFSMEEKLNYKTRLQDIFNRLNKCHEAFSSYYETYLEYLKIFNQKPINNSQYIAYSKRVDEVVAKKKQYGSMARMTIKSFMDSLAFELGTLLEDLNTEQKHISNPQTVLEFSYEIEGEKKLKDKKVYEAIEIIYNYASALAYRLSPEGDLSGDLEFNEDENKPGGKPVNEEQTPASAPRDSLFDELDDII